MNEFLLNTPFYNPMPLSALNSTWQSAQDAAVQKAQQWNQQALKPAADYFQTTWQGGVQSPSSQQNTSWVDRTIQTLTTNYVRNQAIELALKSQLANLAGLPQLAEFYEKQRQATLNQLTRGVSTVAWNAVAPDPRVVMATQWQLAQALATELGNKGSDLKAKLLSPNGHTPKAVLALELNNPDTIAISQAPVTVPERTLTPASEVGTVTSP